MEHTGTAELLGVWEAGAAQPEHGRALLLHRAARPDAADRELLSVPAGEREADLVALRGALFGERMRVCAECGACGETVEFDLDGGGLLPPRPARGPLRVEAHGWTVEFTPPTVADLAAAARDAHPRRALLDRCVTSAVHAGAPRTAADLPGPVQQALAEAAEQADPAAGIRFGIRCPECGEATAAELDIAAYLWAELDAWARQTLLDVHLLAGAYGWSEPEILALSPLRRRYYLELCADG